MPSPPSPSTFLCNPAIPNARPLCCRAVSGARPRPDALAAPAGGPAQCSGAGSTLAPGGCPDAQPGPGSRERDRGPVSDVRIQSGLRRSPYRQGCHRDRTGPAVGASPARAPVAGESGPAGDLTARLRLPLIARRSKRPFAFRAKRGIEPGRSHRQAIVPGPLTRRGHRPARRQRCRRHRQFLGKSRPNNLRTDGAWRGVAPAASISRWTRSGVVR